MKKFNDWLGTLNFKHKIVIAGNHDLTFDPVWYEKKWKRFHHQKMDNEAIKKSLTNCTYLEDSSVEVDGIKIYGTFSSKTFVVILFR